MSLEKEIFGKTLFSLHQIAFLISTERKENLEIAREALREYIETLARAGICKGYQEEVSMVREAIAFFGTEVTYH